MITWCNVSEFAEFISHIGNSEYCFGDGVIPYNLYGMDFYGSDYFYEEEREFWCLCFSSFLAASQDNRFPNCYIPYYFGGVLDDFGGYTPHNVWVMKQCYRMEVHNTVAPIQHSWANGLVKFDYNVDYPGRLHVMVDYWGLREEVRALVDGPCGYNCMLDDPVLDAGGNAVWQGNCLQYGLTWYLAVGGLNVGYADYKGYPLASPGPDQYGFGKKQCQNGITGAWYTGYGISNQDKDCRYQQNQNKNWNGVGCEDNNNKNRRLIDTPRMDRDGNLIFSGRVMNMNGTDSRGSSSDSEDWRPPPTTKAKRNSWDSHDWEPTTKTNGPPTDDPSVRSRRRLKSDEFEYYGGNYCGYECGDLTTRLGPLPVNMLTGNTIDAYVDDPVLDDNLAVTLMSSGEYQKYTLLLGCTGDQQAYIFCGTFSVNAASVDVPWPTNAPTQPIGWECDENGNNCRAVQYPVYEYGEEELSSYVEAPLYMSQIKWILIGLCGLGMCMCGFMYFKNKKTVVSIAGPKSIYDKKSPQDSMVANLAAAARRPGLTAAQNRMAQRAPQGARAGRAQGRAQVAPILSDREKARLIHNQL